MNVGPGLTNQSVAPHSVTETLDQIHELDAAALTLQETGGTLASTGAEQTLYLNDNPLGCFRPACVFVDLDQMAGGDTVIFRVYYRVKAGDDLKVQYHGSYTGANGGLGDDKELLVIDLYPNRYGIWVTLEQTAGVARDYDWSVFTEE